MNNNDCSVLVASCDKYEDAWDPFFTLLKKYWSGCKFPLYLSTETKQYSNSDVTVLNTDSKNWGERVESALARIDSEYVILFLEDFFLQKEVDNEEIERCLERLRTNSSIAVFYFSKIDNYDKPSSKFEKYVQMIPTEHNDRYMINCQAAVWRKTVLSEAVKQSSNPWELEENAFQKLPKSLQKMDFYCLKNSWYDAIREGDVFSYLLVRELGYGIWKSKWLWNNKKLFKKEGIKVRTKGLGRMYKIQYDLLMLKRKIQCKLRNRK